MVASFFIFYNTINIKQKLMRFLKCRKRVLVIGGFVCGKYYQIY
jgi:hypothetical protein